MGRQWKFLKTTEHFDVAYQKEKEHKHYDFDTQPEAAIYKRKKVRKKYALNQTDDREKV